MIYVYVQIRTVRTTVTMAAAAMQTNNDMPTVYCTHSSTGNSAHRYTTSGSITAQGESDVRAVEIGEWA